VVRRGGGLWKLSIPVGSGAEQQRVILLLESKYANNTIGATTDFVRILGYTAFRIHHYNAAPNTVWAEAISGLYVSPEALAEDVDLGMAVRLIGWSQ
jgi:hypothetical protein